MTDLRDILKNVSGMTFVGLDTMTRPLLKGGKKNVMQGRITKVIVGSSVMVFQNKTINGYEAMVKRRLEAEGKDSTNFQLGERKWGERIPDLPLVEHVKDGEKKFYLEVIFLRAGEVFYFLDGSPIDKQDIEGLQEVAVSEDAQGGLDNQVIIRTFSVDSLLGVRIDGYEYTGPFTCEE